MTEACTEVHTYRADGTMHVTSGEEIADVTYEISDQPDATGVYTLTETLVSVNGKPDCIGAATPPGSEDVITQSVRFNDQGDRMEVCGTNGRISYCGGFVRTPNRP